MHLVQSLGGMQLAAQQICLEYQRRDPSKTLLYEVVSHNLETFLQQCQVAGDYLPGYIEDEFRRFPKCGIADFGFARFCCESCGDSVITAFSCKGRAFCGSCLGRRMAETAAHLVDHVFPKKAPVRQWILTLPVEIRYRVAYDKKLCADLLNAFFAGYHRILPQAGKGKGVYSV